MKKPEIVVLVIAFLIFPTRIYNKENMSKNLQGSNSAYSFQLAQVNPLTRRSHNEEEIDRMLQQLNLSEKQSRQIEVIKQEFKTENETLKQQIQKHRLEMRSLLNKEASRDQLMKEYHTTNSLLQRLAGNHFEVMLQVRQILTPQQRGQLAKLTELERN